MKTKQGMERLSCPLLLASRVLQGTLTPLITPLDPHYSQIPYSRIHLLAQLCNPQNNTVFSHDLQIYTGWKEY